MLKDKKDGPSASLIRMILLEQQLINEIIYKEEDGAAVVITL